MSDEQRFRKYITPEGEDPEIPLEAAEPDAQPEEPVEPEGVPEGEEQAAEGVPETEGEPDAQPEAEAEPETVPEPEPIEPPDADSFEFPEPATEAQINELVGPMREPQWMKPWPEPDFGDITQRVARLEAAQVPQPKSDRRPILLPQPNRVVLSFKGIANVTSTDTWAYPSYGELSGFQLGFAIPFNDKLVSITGKCNFIPGTDADLNVEWGGQTFLIESIEGSVGVTDDTTPSVIVLKNEWIQPALFIYNNELMQTASGALELDLVVERS